MLSPPTGVGPVSSPSPPVGPGSVVVGVVAPLRLSLPAPPPSSHPRPAVARCEEIVATNPFVDKAGVPGAEGKVDSMSLDGLAGFPSPMGVTGGILSRMKRIKFLPNFLLCMWGIVLRT